MGPTHPAPPSKPTSPYSNIILSTIPQAGPELPIHVPQLASLCLSLVVIVNAEPIPECFVGLPYFHSVLYNCFHLS